MNKKKICASLLAVVGGTLLTLSMAVPANAATTTGAADGGQDCGVFIDTGVTVCVPDGADLHAAVAQQTGRTIVIGTAKTDAAAAASPLSTQTTSYLLGRLYDDQNYGGSYEEFYGLNTGCSPSAGFGWVDIGSSWYGRVSAFHSYSSCKTKIFEKTNYGGATYGFYAHSSYVGDAMNDRTKSVQFSY